jgi:hypothetical protein
LPGSSTHVEVIIMSCTIGCRCSSSNIQKQQVIMCTYTVVKHNHVPDTQTIMQSMLVSTKKASTRTRTSCYHQHTSYKSEAKWHID